MRRSVRRRFVLFAWGWFVTFALNGGAFPYRLGLVPNVPELGEAGMRGSSCNTCHTTGGGTARNPFGLDWEATWGGGRDAGLTPAEAFAPLAALDSDGDGFTNAQELDLRTHPGNAESRPLRFVRILDAGLNTLSVPVRPGPDFRVADLVDVLGEGLVRFIVWDVEAKQFRLYEPGDDLPVTGQAAFFVEMAAPLRLELVGRAWDEDVVTLAPGINFVALPRRPTVPLRLSDLLGGVGLGIALSPDGSRFLAHHPRFSAEAATNVLLEGGKGYLVISPTARTVSIVGDAWDGETVE